MKQFQIILGLILLASVTTFAQSPRIKLNQITKDTVKGSVLISNPTDSGMVYSRDFYIAYGVDTLLILYGDTIGGVGGGVNSIVVDPITLNGNGTTASPLSVDTATVISTIQGLVDTLSNYVTTNTTQTISGAKTFTANTNFDSGTLYVDATQNRVGINTSSPEAALHLTSNLLIDNAVAIRSKDPSGNVNDMFNYFSDGNLYIGTGASNANVYFRNPATALTIQSLTGNVGIGTTSPQAPLHFKGSFVLEDPDTTNGTDNVLNIIGPGQTGSGANGAEFNFSVRGVGSTTTSEGPAIAMRGNNFSRFTGERGAISLIAGSGMTSPTGNDGSILFYTGGAVKMKVANNGNVGINTTSPSNKLTVNGDAYIGVSSATTPQLTVLGGSGGNDILQLSRTSGVEASYGFNISGGRFNFKDVTNSKPLLSFGIESTYTDVSLGNDEASASTSNGSSGLLRANNSGGAGSNISGGSVFIRTGRGTGTGALPDIYFQTADVTTSGTTRQGFTDKMTIKGNGNVGIGTTSPAYQLSLKDSIGFEIYSSAPNALDAIKAIADNNGAVFGVQNRNPSGYSGVEYLNNLGDPKVFTGFNNSTKEFRFNNVATGGYINFMIGSQTKMRVTNGGETWINNGTDRGSYYLQVAGSGVWGQGAYVNGSDFNLKENITPLNSSLQKVLNLNPIKYNYKQEYSIDQSPQLGFIAQEVSSALGEYSDAVVKDNGDFLSMAYQNLTPLLTKAIQEQQAIIETQQTEIDQLKTLITDLTNRLTILENK